MTEKRPHFFKTLVLAVAITMSGTVAHANAPLDPLAVYGLEHRFTVMRNGEAVGEHRLDFARTASGLSVEAHFELEIPFLFFTAYRYSYRSVAQWQNGQLIRLEAETDDDGERSRVFAERGSDGKLWISGPKGSLAASPDILPTNHWNPQVVTRDQVLNTITGALNAVTIRNLGEETVETSDGSVRARHYLYTGELHNEVWYDDSGRWVKMRFPARDGSVIEYLCQTCGTKRNTEMSQDG
jgi:hypothetical protein